MIIKLNDGEHPIQHAPRIPLENGGSCIPQHYLRFSHSKFTLESIVNECHFDDNYIFFVGEDYNGLYLQVGIVGYDTYHPGNKKIVYGRKWRIDSQTPTSEIIQTLFLAVKKAREHEIRELLKLQIEGKWSAPFSTHQDLPLIAHHKHEMLHTQFEQPFSVFRQEAETQLQNLLFDGMPVQLLNIEQRQNQQLLIDLIIECDGSNNMLSHGSQNFTLLLPYPCTNLMLHKLMAALIDASDAYIAERFCYRGIKRFSALVSVTKLSLLSLRTRAPQRTPELARSLSHLNAQVDRSRVPIVSGQEAKKVKAKLDEFGALDGFYPSVIWDANPVQETSKTNK